MFSKLLKRTPRIGLALSGGGVRATTFQLGILMRLAHEQRLEQIEVVSSVSGGSFCMGLILAVNDYKWPSSDEFLQDVLPKTRQFLTTYDFNTDLFWKSLRRVNVFNSLADDLAALIGRHWQMDANLADLPASPRWLINATTHETGENFRFERNRFGDKVLGYVQNPDFPLNRALAASAGVPVYIGGLYLETGDFNWVKQTENGQMQASKPPYGRVRLWDGAVFDNLGIEGLVDAQDEGANLNFFIVCDAERPFANRTAGNNIRMIGRVIDISSNQMSRLRLGMMEQITTKRGINWAHVKIGQSARQIVEGKLPKDVDMEALIADSMWMAQVQTAYQIETTLRRLEDDEFDRLLRHGFETADYTLLVDSGLVAESIRFEFQWLADMKQKVAENGVNSAETPPSDA